MTKKLLVGATFRDAQPDQLAWLKLQLAFLNDTTEDFDHVSYVNGKGRYSVRERPDVGNIRAFDSYNTRVVGIGEAHTQREPSPTSAQHINSLNCLLAYFKRHQHNYEYFLFLDNDAFPIRRGWLADLVQKMNEFSKIIAVVVRPENLEIRWHASVLMAKAEALSGLEFQMMRIPGGDFMGIDEWDVGIGRFQDSRRGEVWPLIRTNRLNVHPVAYGVYFDMFYHQTFGGRRHVKRGRDTNQPWDTLRWGRNNYATQYFNPNYAWDQYNEEMRTDPTGFIKKLAGWSPDRYASFEVAEGAIAEI
jgi:hypothetical protein